jgi:hypothetical protein
VEDNAQGIQTSWSRPLLERAEQEAMAHAQDAEKTQPTRQAMGELSPMAISEVLGGAQALLRVLESAQLVEEHQESYGGQTARCLAFKVVPRLPKSAQKYVKEIQAAAKVWLAPDGTPLGAQVSHDLKGSAMLVIKFEDHEKTDYRFTKVGDRLVTTYRQTEKAGSGGGEHGNSRTTLNLELKS